MVADEEQLINEIPRPRHGQIRRIINSAIAAHHIGRIEPFCDDLCHRLLDDILGRPAPDRPRGRLRHAGPEQRDRPPAGGAAGGLPPVGGVVRRGGAGHLPDQESQRSRRGPRRGPPRVRRPTSTPSLPPGGSTPGDDFVTRLIETEVDGRATDRRRGSQPARLPLHLRERDHRGTSSPTSSGRSPTTLTFSMSYAAPKGARANGGRGVPPPRPADPVPHAQLHRRGSRSTTSRCARWDKIAFGIASANRDETHFEDPHHFRLDRPDPRGHIAFGGGPHVCPGASLARLEARVALDAFLDRVASVRPLPPVATSRSRWAGPTGLERLDVELSPPTRRARRRSVPGVGPPWPVPRLWIRSPPGRGSSSPDDPWLEPRRRVHRTASWRRRGGRRPSGLEAESATRWGRRTGEDRHSPCVSAMTKTRPGGSADRWCPDGSGLGGR